jgi:hypothetical protein
MWESRGLTTVWVSTACYRDSFTFFICLLPRNIRIKIYKIRKFLPVFCVCVNLDLPYERKTIYQCISTCPLCGSLIPFRYAYPTWEGIVMRGKFFSHDFDRFSCFTRPKYEKVFFRCCLHVQWMVLRPASAWTVGRILFTLSIQEFIRGRSAPDECGHSRYKNNGPSHGPKSTK